MEEFGEGLKSAILPADPAVSYHSAIMRTTTEPKEPRFHSTAEPQVPWVDSPRFEETLAERCPDAKLQAQARFLREKGYLVLENVFPAELLDQVVADVRPLFDPNVADGPRSRIRVQDAWEEVPSVRAMATAPQILDLLRVLYGKEPFAFQTLNFQFGTEQRGHQDSSHFSSLPEGFMCGLWVALEDVGPENGTLFYYPGSHRLPRLSNDELGLGFRNPNSTRPFNPDIARSAQEAYLERQLALSGLQRESFAAPKGSVILWAAGLVHGGSKILSPGRSRWSQVTHYFFHDCLYTTPMHCADFIGDFYLRRVRDVATGEVVPNRYYGLPVEGVEDNYLYKLVTDVVGDRERVRAMRHDQLRSIEDERDMLRGEVDRRRAEIDQLRAQVSDIRQVLSEVEASPSFRLGRTLTAPLRGVRNLVRPRH